MHAEPRGLEFPCRFPIRIMGAAEDGFEALVLEIVRRHVPDLDPADVSKRPSRQGRYISLTVRFTATSREQLDDLYRALSSCEQISVVL